MKKACGTWLAVYLLLAAAVAALVFRRFPEQSVAIGAGFIGGGVLWLAVGYFWGIRTKLGGSAMIRGALSGVPPTDGAKMAAIGRIEPAGSALTAPLSGTRCVAYKYEIFAGSGDDKSMYYDGFALTPSVIQTRQGNIRLLAWTDLKVSPMEVPAATAVKNAQQYIASTQFREPGIRNIRHALGEMLEIYRDDDGSVRYDQMGMQTFAAATNDLEPVDLETARYREWILRPGEPVCVIGTYSAERGGIVPSKTPIADPVTLETGEPESFAGRQAGGAAGYFIGGVIFTAIALVALAVFLTFVPLDATEQMSPAMRVTWQEVALEQLIDKRIREPLRRRGIINPNETTAIALPDGAARGRVRSGANDRDVTRVFARGDAGGRTFDIDDGSVTLSVDPNGNPLRLAVLNRDVSLQDAWIRVTGPLGRITYLSKDLACHVTFNAGSR